MKKSAKPAKPAKSSMSYFYLFIAGCTDPELSVPFKSAKKRDTAAKKYWKEFGSEQDAIFRVATSDTGHPPTVTSFLSGELDEDKDEET